jgi:hypothetical protein
MRRPWKVAVAVVVGAALVPSSALAAPSITITNPENGKTYTKGTPVAVAFTCSNATECTATDGKGAPLANGAALDTTTIGPSFITVTAKDAAGGSAVAQSGYNVAEAGDGGGGGDVPATLNLTLGTPTAFAPFIPGIGKDYTATLATQLLSTAGDAALTVTDPSATQTGHLMNGEYALSAGLQVAGARPVADGQPAPTLTFAPIGGSSAPTTVLTYDGPLNETDTLTFKQPIAATDSLRTGSYSKTLTFTLSTTTP